MNILTVILNIGLADGCITNTLVGLPFMVRADLVSDSSQKMSLVFGSSWKLSNKKLVYIYMHPRHVEGGYEVSVLIPDEANNTWD